MVLNSLFLSELYFQEVKQYIENIIEVYGHFNYAPVDSKFTVNEIGLCLKRMDPQQMKNWNSMQSLGSERIEKQFL